MKNKITVKEAVLDAYKKMPKNFNGIELIKTTRKILHRASVYDGTIMRELRYLRDNPNCTINYIVVDIHNSKYQKLKNKKRK